MGTQFEEIYCLNAIIKEDQRLLNLPTNQQYLLQWKYLLYAINYFVYDYRTDKDDRVGLEGIGSKIDFSQEEYYFIGDGVDNEFLLSPTPPTSCVFYIGVKQEDDLVYDSNYTGIFNEITNVLTITPTPPLNYQVYISGYIIGSFTDTLNTREQTILAEGMNVPFEEEKVNTESLLEQMVYGGTTKLYSQANHISAIKDISNNQYYAKVQGLISEYTYKDRVREIGAKGSKLAGLRGDPIS
jgi:hypothetical protein